MTIVRDWRNWVIVLVLLLHLLIPLGYSRGVDRHDERFAWRMFSAERMTRCQARLSRDGRPVHLMREFHAAWSQLIIRGRRQIISAVLDRLCAEPGQLTYRVACREADGTMTILRDGICSPEP